MRLFFLTAMLLAAWLPRIGTAAPAATDKPYKSFAVFAAYWDPVTHKTTGGVAGTLFFISPTEAITAFHVLKKESFAKREGYSHLRIWAMHEKQGAIELKPEYLTTQKENDLTRVHLPANLAVPQEYVFATERVNPILQEVETEGFRANTAGPLFEFNGDQLVVKEVRNLQRLRSRGTLLRQARVAIKAKDIELNGSPSIKVSYEPIVGMSGGPVTASGAVIGMNSFAEPSTFKETWALELRPAGQTVLNP